MALPARPEVLIGANEMTSTGGQSDNQQFIFSTEGAHLDYQISLTKGGPYRIDISAQALQGKAAIAIYLQGEMEGVVTVTSPAITLYSVFIADLSPFPYTLSLQLMNYELGMNTAKAGLIYFTPTSNTMPEVLNGTIPSSIPPGTILEAGHFLSGYLRGFNATSFPTQNEFDDRDLSALKSTGANIARCQLIVDHSPDSNTYYFVDSLGQAAPDALSFMDAAVNIAENDGFYIIITLCSFRNDIWGAEAGELRDALGAVWADLALRYRGKVGVAGYDLLDVRDATYNYAAYLRWAIETITTMRLFDNEHTVIIEAVRLDMLAMMQQLPFDNIVYAVHGYDTQSITQQGEDTADAGQTVRNKYPLLSSSENLSAPWGAVELSQQYNDVRTFSQRFHAPMLVAEFSCVNWAPPNDDNKWTSTQYVSDSIDLFEKETWAWCYHSWRNGMEWDSEIDSSFYLPYPYINARPIGSFSEDMQDANRTPSAPTRYLLDSWFVRNKQPVFSIPAGQIKGFYAMGYPDPVTVNSLKPDIKGFFIRNIKWSELEIAEGIFDWAKLDTPLSICMNAGLPVSFMISTGPDSPQWIYEALPRINTTGGQPNQPTEYPWYLDARYAAVVKAMIAAVNSHLGTFSSEQRNAIAGWQCTEGVGSETFPWYGTPVTTDPDTGVPYVITNDQWIGFARDIRSYFYATNTRCTSIFNAGEHGQEWEWILITCPGAGIKNNQPGREFGYDGELVTFNRPDKPELYRTESEQVQNYPWWSTQVFMPLVCQALHGGITNFCIGAPSVNRSLMDFYNRHAGTKSRGFTLMHKAIDFTDINLYTESVYGFLISPADIVAYQEEITQAEATYTGVYLEYIKMTILRKYTSTARIDNIKAQMASYGAKYNPGNLYEHNYGYMTFPGNYEKGIRIVDHGLMTYQWRLGAKNQPYGLSALSFGIGRTDFYLDMDSDFEVQPMHTVRVTYWDGIGCWSLSYNNGADRTEAQVRAMGTYAWLTRDFSVGNLHMAGLADGHVFRINKCSNESVPFGMIEIV